MEDIEIEGIYLKLQNSDEKRARQLLENLSVEEKKNLDEYIQKKNAELKNLLEDFRKSIEKTREKIVKLRKK